MNTPSITSSHLALIKEIFKKNLPSNTIVWLFGSRLFSTCKKYSDVDFLIDCQGKKLSSLILINLKEDFDESDLPYKVDLLDWHQITDEFKNNIANKQILFKF